MPPPLKQILASFMLANLTRARNKKLVNSFSFISYAENQVTNEYEYTNHNCRTAELTEPKKSY